MTERQIHYEDVEIGDELPDMTKIPSRAQLFMYSAITWNVHRIHYDEAYAKTEGHPTVLVHGPLQGAFFGQFMADWVAPGGRLKKISYSNRGLALPDEPYTVKGRVTGKRIEDGQHLIDCEIRGENQNGDVAAIGSATAIVPTQ